MKNINDFKSQFSKKYFDLLDGKNVFSRNYSLNNEFNQIDIYCFLKYKFGMPNGMQSFLRGNHSNNFIQWNYCLEFDNKFIDIQGSTRFMEMRIISDEEIEPDINEIIISIFKSEIRSHKSEINSLKKKFEYWNLFINTFKRNETAVTEFYSKYNKIKIKEPDPIYSPLVTKQTFKKYQYQVNKMTESISEKKNYGLVLRMIIPVLGESLLNLILYVLLKDEIRSDKRLVDNVFRQQIDIRIKTMHLNCNYLDNQYNQDDIRFKNFLKIMNKRNDFLHGNVMPIENTFDHVHFDGTIPFMKNEQDMSIEFLKQNMFQITDDIIDNDYENIMLFKEFILENVNDSVKNEVLTVIDKNILGFRKDTKSIGVLFDNHLLQSFLIKK